MRTSLFVASVAASVMAAAVGVAAQQTSDQCVSLKGSTQCPSFQDAYVNPSNLSSAWPWFSQVSDVQSFDDQFAQYFTDPTRFIATKLNRQLQCNRTGSDNTTLQWERTILCGQFSQISYSAQCNIQNRADPIMVCQDTCIEYSDSENTIVANPQICTPTDSLTYDHNQTRAATLLKDYVTCTNWTSLVSTNNATCVSGASNEGNCGYGPGVSTQLCEVCDPSGNRTVPACCYDRQTDLSQCASYGHPGAAAVVATTSVATGFQTATSSSSTGQATGSGGSSRAGQDNQNGGGGTNLSGGQLAGIIVGCIAGAALLGAFLAWLLFGRRRRNKQDHEASRGLVYGAAGAGAAGAASREKNSGGWNHSDADTARSLGGSPADNKSPRSMDGGAPLVGGAALAGAGAGAGAGAAAAGAASASHDRPQSGLSSGTTGSGTDGRGTTVAVVKDQYTGQDIFPGEEVVAIYPYNASLNDELTLEPEQRLTVLRLYDDGWALGRTLDGKEGALPLVCVSSAKGDAPARLRAGSARDTTTGTSDDEGLTSGNEGGFTSSVDGAVTADEG
ncbi:hypothetical protein FA10DRAFT_220976, partial [Acaromyces ingoldii]